MFVSKSYHLSEVRRLESERDFAIEQSHILNTRIAELKTHMADLRLLVFPKNQEQPTFQALEADAVLDASPKPVELSEAEFNKIRAAEREADLIFSGNYSEDLLQ